MALDVFKFIKGIVIRNEADMTKQFELKSSASSTTSTKTILQSAQTADRTITLPDTTDTLVAATPFNNLATDVANKADKDLSNLTNPTAISQDLTFDMAGTSTVQTSDQTTVNSEAMRVLSGDVAGVGLGSGGTFFGSGSSADATSGVTTLSTGAAATTTGNTEVKTGSGSGANSTTGNIIVQTGTPTGSGTKGFISQEALYSKLKSQTPLRLYDAADTKFVGFKAPTTVTTSVTYILPVADGGANQALTTDGAGNLAWSATVVGANIALSNLTSPTQINQNLLPDTDLTYNLGSASLIWNAAWINSIAECADIRSSGNIELRPDDAVIIRDNANLAAKPLRFYENDSTNYVALKAPGVISADITWTLPAVDGTSGDVLSTNGSGILSWLTDVSTKTYVNNRFSAIYDAIVGSAGQVSSGFASHSTITAAIAAIPTNGSILILNGSYTETISVNKSCTITGQGSGSIINGTVTFTSAADYCKFEKIYVTNNIVIDSGSNFNDLSVFWLGNGFTITDNGTSNYILAIQD